MALFSLQTGEAILSIMYILLPILLGSIHGMVQKGGKGSSQYIFLYYLLISVAIQGLLTGIVQLAKPEFVSGYLGVSYDTHLIELGMANLSFGIVALLSFWFDRGWKIASAVAYSLFLIFTGSWHLIDMAKYGVLPRNFGPFLFSDLLVPIAIFFLLAIKPFEKAR